MSIPVLRAMRWWDLPRVHDLEAACFTDDPWSPETFWSELAERRTRRYLILQDGGEALLGYAGVAVVAGIGEVQTIAVDPAARGRGLGRTLLSAGLAAARELGAGPVHLEVRADNAAALTLYERAGFARTGLRRGYYRARPGQAPVDAVTMMLDVRRMPDE